MRRGSYDHGVARAAARPASASRADRDWGQDSESAVGVRRPLHHGARDGGRGQLAEASGVAAPVPGPMLTVAGPSAGAAWNDAWNNLRSVIRQQANAHN